MSDFLKVFDKKRVFITGHTGFKGAWLSELLLMCGAEVCGYALPPTTSPNLFDLLSLEERVINHFADIRDYEKLNSAIKEFEPEFVFHLAAQALVLKSYREPLETFSTNVIGSANLLQTVRDSNSIRSLVFVTSDKCYENKEWERGYHEDDLLGGRDPYSASKAAAELVHSSFNRSYFVDKVNFGSATARAGNVIGGGDWSDNRIIPDCVRALSSNVPIMVRNPAATRPWQHVLEPISGYLKLSASLYEDASKYQGSWNFGPNLDQSKTVLEVVKILVASLGTGTIELAQSIGEFHEAGLLQLDCTKAKNELNWHPSWDSIDSVTATADWYSAWMRGEHMPSFTRKQIREYFPELEN